MRSLSASDNTDAASPDYPYRKVRDTVDVTPGTKLRDRIFGDMIHGFQKLIRLVGFAPNDLPDNETNGYQILDALELLGQPRVFEGNLLSGNILHVTDINTLKVGKMYKFISDKNLINTPEIQTSIGEPYQVKFQNCSFILANQPFNAYVVDLENVTATPIGTVNEFYGAKIQSFENFDNISFVGGMEVYKGKCYVTLPNNSAINIYSDGFLIRTITDTNLSGAQGITILKDKIYVAIPVLNQIRVYSLTGSFLTTFQTGDNPSILRSSNKTGKIYVITDAATNNCRAYTDAGLLSFTFSGADQFVDIVVYDSLAYLMSIPASGETYIKKYNAENGALLTGGLNTFTAANNVNRFYGVNENYFFLNSGIDVVLVDRNYEINDPSDQFRDILKTLIYGNDLAFSFGLVQKDTIYFTLNDSESSYDVIYKFI